MTVIIPLTVIKTRYCTLFDDCQRASLSSTDCTHGTYVRSRLRARSTARAYSRIRRSFENSLQVGGRLLLIKPDLLDWLEFEARR